MTTYTLYRTAKYDNNIIARGLSAVDAMYFIIEHDPTRHFEVFAEFFETFIRFDFALFARAKVARYCFTRPCRARTTSKRTRAQHSK